MSYSIMFKVQHTHNDGHQSVGLLRGVRDLAILSKRASGYDNFKTGKKKDAFVYIPKDLNSRRVCKNKTFIQNYFLVENKDKPQLNHKI